MNRPSTRSVFAIRCGCAFVLLSTVACGAKSSTDSSAKPDASASSRSSAAASAKSVAAKTTASPSAATTPPAASGSAAGKQVSVDRMLDKADNGHEERSGLLAVDMSGVDDGEAPALGGANVPSVAKPATGGKLTWLDEGALAVPNPGWAAKSVGQMQILASPDSKVAFVFNHFTTDADGTDKANKFITGMKLTATSWKKPEKVKVGKDNLPGILGVGHGKNSGGHGMKVIYLFIKTGAPENVMCIGVFDDDASKADTQDIEGILGNIHKK